MIFPERVGFHFFKFGVMKARYVADLFEKPGEKLSPPRQSSAPGVSVFSDSGMLPQDSAGGSSMAAAAAAAKDMADRSAVLVEMMEELEKRLRRQAANLSESDPPPAGSPTNREISAPSESESQIALPSSNPPAV